MQTTFRVELNNLNFECGSALVSRSVCVIAIRHRRDVTKYDAGVDVGLTVFSETMFKLIDLGTLHIAQT